MRIDKQVHVVFRACPEIAYDLAGLPFPGECRVESPVFKELERRADVLFVPEDAASPLCMVEVQFQPDATVYTRLVVEMALQQEKGGCAREIQGVVFFGRRSLDPATRPWCEVVHAVYMDEALARLRESQPNHPAVDVFAPVWIPTEAGLEASAKDHYNRLNALPLEEPRREALIRAFMSWLFERLKTDDRKHIAMILDLPDITETAAGRELIGIGLERGRQKGREEAAVTAIRKIGARHFGGPASDELDARVLSLPLPLKEELVVAMMDQGSWEDVQAWIEQNHA